jgi:phenylalanyl-tRNA synthetase beta chain
VVSPDLTPVIIEADAQFINKLVGVELSIQEIIKCLEKSRCNGSLKGSDTIICSAPSYRGDLFGPQDLCEEVLIGLGVGNFSPQYPSTKLVGKKNNFSKVFDKIRDVMMGLGFVEILNTSIISEHLIKSSLVDTDLSKDNYIWLQDTENTKVEALRPSLIPSMINTLSVNIHEKYPQFLFEIGKTFKQERNQIVEGWSLCTSIAHDTTDFSEIKSNLESLMKYCFDISIQTPIASKPFLLNGHSAFVSVNDTLTGYVGEFHPQVLEDFNMRTLVSVFEVDLTKLMEILNLTKNGYI